MAVAEFKTPKIGEYPVIPHLQEGVMAHSKPYVAKPDLQEKLGYPGELVDNWKKWPLKRWANSRASTAHFRYSWIPV